MNEEEKQAFVKVALANVELMRLNADLAKAQSEIDSNQEKSTEGKKGLSKFWTEKVTNNIRGGNREEYTKEKNEIQGKIDAFKKEHEGMDLSLAENADAFKAKLDEFFGEDKDHVAKNLFVVAIVLDRSQKYVHEDEGIKAVSKLLYGDGAGFGASKSAFLDVYASIAEDNVFGSSLSKLSDEADKDLLAASLKACAGVSSLGEDAEGIESFLIAAGLMGNAFAGLNEEQKGAVSTFVLSKPEQEIGALYGIKLFLAYQARIGMTADEFKPVLTDLICMNNSLKNDSDVALFVEKKDLDEGKKRSKLFARIDTFLVQKEFAK